MEIEDFKQCINMINEKCNTNMELGIIDQDLDVMFCYPLHSITLIIELAEQKLWTNRFTIRHLIGKEEALWAIAHEAGHIVHHDMKRSIKMCRKYGDDMGIRYMEMEADEYATTLCSELKLDIYRCSKIFDLLSIDEVFGEKHPPSSQRRYAMLRGHYNKDEFPKPLDTLWVKLRKWIGF